MADFNASVHVPSVLLAIVQFNSFRSVIPSLSSSISRISDTPSLSVSTQALIFARDANV